MALTSARARLSARGWAVALVAVTFVWGATFVVVQEAIDRLPVFPFNAWRFALAAAVLSLLTRRQLRRLGRRGWLHGGLLGVALWGGYALQTFGLARTTAPKAAFITGMVVVITPLLQALLLRRSPSAAAGAGALLAAAGLGLLVLEGRLVPSLGDVLVLGCAVSFAIHVVGLGAWSGRHPVGALAAVQLLVGALLHTAGGVVQDLSDPARFDWVPDGMYVWAAIVFTAVFASALAFVVQTAAQRVLSPTRAAIIFTMEPVFAWLTSWLVVPLLVAAGIRGLEAETFGPRQGVGALLVLAGMLLAELRSAEPPDTLAAAETGALASPR